MGIMIEFFKHLEVDVWETGENVCLFCVPQSLSVSYLPAFTLLCSITSRGDIRGAVGITGITGSCVHIPCIEHSLLNFFRSSSSLSTLPQSSLRGRSLHNSSCKPFFFLPGEWKTSFQNVSCWAKARFYLIFDTQYFLSKVKIAEFFLYQVTLQNLFHQPLEFLQPSGTS